MPNSHLPQHLDGDFSTFSTLSQSLSFHSSPESFISSRIQQAVSSEPGLTASAAAKQRVICARLLNRNVAVVSSYQLCKDVLRAESGESQSTVSSAGLEGKIGPGTFAVRPAYDELMSEFFPPPNLLLEDFPGHAAYRADWDQQLSSFPADVTPLIRDIVKEHIGSFTHGSTIDLYNNMKDLSWRILLGVFLQLSPTDKAFSSIESSQETLLRGQFSLFPVSVNAVFWRSPRSKGIEARRRLQTLLKDQIKAQDSGCPFLRQNKVSKDDIASHALFFTSSIAVKALASLLTASLLNLFLLPCDPPLASRIESEGPVNGEVLLKSILLETERLSPPVVGVMRRVQRDVILAAPEGQSDTLIPSGWDVWLYFAGAGRDPAVFELADTFLPERFISPAQAPSGFAFGSGSKSCLSEHLIRQIVLTVAQTMLDSGIRLDGTVKEQGVKGWLGWESDVGAKAFAKDLKQLPCQRPKEAIKVSIHHESK